MEKKSFNRRNFLKTGTSAGAASILLPQIVLAKKQEEKTAIHLLKQNSELAKRKLGSLEVTALGAGCMNFVHAYYPRPSKKDAIELIRTPYEMGINFFDVAQSYGPFTGEELVGEALAPIRDKVIISTKFGHEFSTDGNGCASTAIRLISVR